ncbi:MAG: GNAT family N-acetyltransferase [Hyphomicrobiaceae bacterium]|nr:GNAT family N-acetyltransferase [Hyphomicrobiaceae bacterium]
MPVPLNCNFPRSIEITTQVSRIDLDRVHNWLQRKSYWAGEMPREVFDRAVRGSLCFAALEGRATVGFARVISDQATFAYVSDVFVDQERRGMGIGKRLLAAMVAHPQLQDLRLWLLATADAHGLYARHGFTSLAAPQRYMERRDAEVYQRMAGAQVPGPSAA